MQTSRRAFLIAVLIGLSLAAGLLLGGLLKPAAETRVPVIEIPAHSPEPEQKQKKKSAQESPAPAPAPPDQAEEVIPAPVAPPNDDENGDDDNGDGDDGPDDDDERGGDD